MRQKRIFAGVALGLLISVFLTSCGTGSNQAADDVAEVQKVTTLSETDLFEFQIAENLVETWGLKSAEKTDLTIKSYSDSKRVNQSEEVESVIPDYCLPIASLLLDSSKSGSNYLFTQIFASELNSFNYLQVQIYAFDSESLANEKFNEFLSVADKCGSWIPKYSDGGTGLEMDLLTKFSASSPDSLAWENSDYFEASGMGIVGSAIYNVSASVENNIEVAKSIRLSAQSHVRNLLESHNK
jgi:hypothetical protein